MFRCTFHSLFLLLSCFDVNSLWRSLNSFFVRIYAHTISSVHSSSLRLSPVQVLLDRVFDCNQNWLIFMRFHSRCCFVPDHLSACITFLGPIFVAVGTIFNYTKSLYRLWRIFSSLSCACIEKGAVISWLHCTLSWLSLWIRCVI